MKSKLFIITALIAVISLGILYQSNKGETSIQDLSESGYGVVNDLTGAAISIKEGSITNKQMTIRLTNETNDLLTYGSFYAIEKYISGKWYTLPYVKENYEWTLEGHCLESNETIEIKTEWKWAYGKLKKGHYRIIKPVTSGPLGKRSKGDNRHKDYDLAAEFDIK